MYWQSTTDPLTNIVTPITAAQVGMLLVLTAGDVAAFYIAFGAILRIHSLANDLATVDSLTLCILLFFRAAIFFSTRMHSHQHWH